MKQYPWNPTAYYDDFAAFAAALEGRGDQPAISEYDRRGTETMHTYRELHADVTSLRRCLAARGLSGRHIGIVGENSYGWIVAFLAVTSGGGVAVCIDIEQPDESIGEMLRQAETETVFCSDSMREICAGLLRDNGDGTRILPLGNGEGGLGTLLEEGRTLREECAPSVGGARPAAIVFTSGTTARPKAVLLSNANLLSNAGAAVAVLDLGESTFSGLPFFHTYGLNCGVIASLLRGTHLTVNGNLRTMLRDLSLSGAETMFTVPLILEVLWKNARDNLEKSGKWKSAEGILRECSRFKRAALLMTKQARKELHEVGFGSLNTVICGGAHMDEKISEAMEILGISVLQGYGITECSPLIAVNRNHFRRTDTVGTILPGWDLKLENGEILVKGPGVMTGYFNDAEATARAVIDGWFHTGDLGALSPDGQLSIVGRIKNLIVLKNGKKISPEHIEALICQIPQVKDAVVYGAASGAVTDDVKPAVSIYPDADRCGGMEQYEILSLLQEKIAEINKSLPTYQQIQMISIREKDFDRSSSQKTLRSFGEAGDETISV